MVGCMDTQERIEAFTREIEQAHPGWIRERRTAYLQSQISRVYYELRRLYWWHEVMRRRGVPEWLRRTMMRLSKLDGLEKDLKIFKISLHYNMHDDNDHVLILMSGLPRACDYPIDKLIDVNKDGYAQCVNPTPHEKDPTMLCSKNLVYCFSCGWYGDAIDVAMVKYNLTFEEALKMLLV